MTVTLKKAVTICLAVALLPCAAALGQQGQSGDDGVKSQPTELPAQSPLTPERLFALASPAVVKLTIKDEDDREIGVASGFIVRFGKGHYLYREGMATPSIGGSRGDVYNSTIITNYHVIRPAISIDVSFTGGHSGTVLQVIAEDESADLAVLSVESLVEPKRSLKLRERANPPIGTKVYAIGSPQGLSNTLSEGLISGYRQRGKHEPWVQITAPISPGSSGGPLFSPEGSVIGVTTAFLSEGQNLNFAVPVSEVSRLLPHTEKSRYVWEGASILKTVRGTFIEADTEFYFRFRRAHPEGSFPDGHHRQTFERFREERLSEGDQLALLLKGMKPYHSKQFAEAISMLRRATKADSGEYAYLAHYFLSRAISNNNRPPGSEHSDVRSSPRYLRVLETVVEPLKRAKRLNPDFGPTFYRLSYVYLMTGKYPEALVEAETLVRLMPRCYDGYHLRGGAWAGLGREEAFERDFDTAWDLRPNASDVLEAKANGYYVLDKLQEAADTYNDALKLDETSVSAHVSLGGTLQRLGKYEEAIKSYQTALKIIGSDSIIEEYISQCLTQMMQSP